MPIYVNANCIHLGSGVYFYWNCNITPSFTLINIFYTRYNKVKHSAPFGQKCPHWNPLKLLFLIAMAFNCKMMQFLLIGFHSVGKASTFYCLLFFTRWCHFFQIWHIKQGYVVMDVREWFVYVYWTFHVCLNNLKEWNYILLEIKKSHPMFMSHTLGRVIGSCENYE